MPLEKPVAAEASELSGVTVPKRRGSAQLILLGFGMLALLGVAMIIGARLAPRPRPPEVDWQ
jgi:hypothetical protein